MQLKLNTNEMEM